MHTIYIRDLTVSATHGYYSFEKEKPQSLVVSVYVDVDDWSHDDNLNETLNYETIREEAIAVLSQSPKNLLETLADQIATRILKSKRVVSCKVTLEKPDIFDNCIPGVSVTRLKSLEAVQQ